MKKITSMLLIVVIMATALLMVACNQTVYALPSVRWEENETLTYNVSMLSSDESKNIVESNDKVSFINAMQLVKFETTDQVMPTAIEGTYTTTMALDNKNYVYTTSLEVEETYKLDENVNKLLDELTAEQTEKIVLAKTETEVTLLTKTTTEVTFKADDSKQTPVSSSKTVLGYYIGKSSIAVTDYNYTCSYGEKEVTTKLTDNGETKTLTATVAVGTIDANQLTIYARSLDQSPEYQSAAPVQVFSPEMQITATAEFAMKSSCPVLLNFGGTNTPSVTTYVAINLKSAEVANVTANAFTMFNNPKDTMSSAFSANGKLNKYTNVKLQSGIYIMELVNYTDAEQEQLTYVATEAE